MAELASGAVSSLLGVIRNEMALLGGVKGDVQFIQEEMESMNSFLVHLARKAPPGGEHDEQVRTWMNQVRVLAQDCNNCLDLYLYRGNPEIHRAKGGVRRYLWWAPWYLQRLVAQHRAATQLRHLKERARDVGERRQRYDVHVPANPSPGQQSAHMDGLDSPSSSAQAARGGDATGDEEDDDGGDQMVSLVTAANHFGPRAFFQPRTLDDYVKDKLLEWIDKIERGADETQSIAIMAPDMDPDALAIANETLVFSLDLYDRVVLVNIPAVHHGFLRLRPKEILYYTLRELQLDQPKSQSQQQQDISRRKWGIYREKKIMLQKIKNKIEDMEVYGKLDKIKRDISVRPLQDNEIQELLRQDFEQSMEQLGLEQVFQLLLHSAAAVSQQDQVKTKDMHKLAACYDSIITISANKLKEFMEAKDDTKFEEHMAAAATAAGGGGTASSGGGGDAAAADGGRDASIGGGRGGGGAATAGGEDATASDGGNGGDGDAVAAGRGREAASATGRGGGGAASTDERQQKAPPILLLGSQYEHILRIVFPNTRSSNPLQPQLLDGSSAAKQPTKTMTTTLGKDQIKTDVVHDILAEILLELKEGKANKNLLAMGESGGLGPTPKQQVAVGEMEKKIDEIKDGIKQQLKIKGLVEEIKQHLNGDCPLIILKADATLDGSKWEDTRNALSLLECSADVLILTTTKSIQEARKFCYPSLEPIDYSLVGLYHDIVLELTARQKNESNYSPQIFRDILEECKPYEFCMKIFMHALHANPKRRNEDLRKLHGALQALPSPKSLNLIANKIFKFSYSDLAKEYKSCLLYVAIFPPGHKIRRSILIGRWVAEGLIFHDDWPNSVGWANRCFDELIDRWLIYPADVGATGKVKSCMVGYLVHGFITKIARKQRIVETRLSRHLARHFSIFNDLRLRSSDGIDKFFKRLSESSRVSLLKVLDLESCKCFAGKKQRYLKVICSKMLLLKYLSLKGTDVNRLPTEINNLRELEVLDIRQTDVREDATASFLLLKLKRLLAGHIIYPSSSSSNTTVTNIGAGDVSSVQIPERIEKMVNVEVLCNVKARNSQDLKDIGKLCQLRKLGVVIDDKESYLRNLLQTISDLQESLCSLSITLPIAGGEGTPSSTELQKDIASCMKHPPKLLENLCISGTTQKVCLLPLFTKDRSKKLAKVTLSRLELNQDDLKALDKLPKLQCLRLKHIAFAKSTLTFKNGKFKYLKYLLVEGSNLNDIIFKEDSARELEKMVLSFTNICSVDGVGGLQKLEELELNNNSSRRLLLSLFENAKKIFKLTLYGTLLEQDHLRILSRQPKMRCLVLLDKSCVVSKITLNKDEFPKLNLLIVDCPSITEIIFTSGSAPKLEKIICSSSFTSLSGIIELPSLKELEFNGYVVPKKKELEGTIRYLSNRVKLRHNQPENQDQGNGEAPDDADDVPRRSFCWKNQV